VKNKFNLKVGKLYRFYSLWLWGVKEDWEAEPCYLPVYRSKYSTNHINIKEQHETSAGTMILILSMDETCCQVLTESGEAGWFSWTRFDTSEHGFREVTSGEREK